MISFNKEPNPLPPGTPNTSDLIQNRFETLKTGEYATIEISRPAWLYFDSDLGTVHYQAHVRPTNDAMANRIVSADGSLYMHAAGTWYVKQSSGADAQVRLSDGGNPYAPASSAAAAVSGGTTPGAPTVGAVGAASAVIVAASPTRRRLWLTNPSAAEKVYIAFGQAAVNGSGFFIAAGGNFILEPESGLASQEIRGITSGGGSFNVGVQAFT